MPDNFFGIDKIYPDDGYIEENVVTACTNCNRAKWDQDPEDFTLRETRITQRYLDGLFDNISNIPKNISHHRLRSKL
jgi:5-methylcytosine-specific restriction endonuclease McrA